MLPVLRRTEPENVQNERIISLTKLPTKNSARQKTTFLVVPPIYFPLYLRFLVNYVNSLWNRMKKYRKRFFIFPLFFFARREPLCNFEQCIFPLTFHFLLSLVSLSNRSPSPSAALSFRLSQPCRRSRNRTGEKLSKLKRTQTPNRADVRREIKRASRQTEIQVS